MCSQLFLTLRKTRWQQRKKSDLTRVGYIQFYIKHSRNYRANSSNVIMKKYKYLNTIDSFNISFYLSIGCSKPVFFLERPVFILGDDNVLHIKHQPVWRCNICQLRVGERKVPRLQLMKHTHLSGSWVDRLYQEHVNREREQQKRNKIQSRSSTEKEKHLFSSGFKCYLNLYIKGWCMICCMVYHFLEDLSFLG